MRVELRRGRALWWQVRDLVARAAFRVLSHKGWPIGGSGALAPPTWGAAWILVSGGRLCDADVCSVGPIGPAGPAHPEAADRLGDPGRSGVVGLSAAGL